MTVVCSALCWAVGDLFCSASVEAEMDVECKENVLSSQPTVIDLTGSDDEDTSTLSPSPIVSTANCLKEFLSGADGTLQPKRCVVDLL